nr:reverse transcriptase domain-containing protein [Tanacetum cinerariifolium]
MFLIDLIPFGHSNFDVIVGMDWLSKFKANIVRFEKILHISLSNREILEVHEEWPEGNVKQLKTLKVNEFKLKDISVEGTIKQRRARAMSMTIHSSIKARILEAHSEASKDVNTLTEMLKGLDKQFERKEDAVREDFKTERSARLYINEIVAWHGVPVSIISDRGSYFASRLWQLLQKALGTRLDLRTTYHPKINGQSERTIQTLEDILRACAMCASFEAIYERKCRTPIAWEEVGESKLFGLEIIQETIDKIVQIKERLKTARDRQKSYANNWRKPLEFSVDDKVLLKVSPRKGVVRFAFLNDDPPLPPPNQGNYFPQVQKELKIYEAKTDKSSIDEPLKVELKDLPPHLEYTFLEVDDKFPVIIAKYFSEKVKTALITVLKSHKRAIAWKLFDIKATEGNGDLPVPDLRTMEELCQPSLNDRGGPISPIDIQTMNFGLKNDMIQQSIKVNGVTDDALRLYLFTHSLTHLATAWFDHLPRNSINTFEQMAKMFLGKYFPPSMVTKLRNEITNFRQHPDESLFEAWERGTFMKRRPEECYDIIENMTAHHID